METQIINDNSCIRVINDGTPVLVIKSNIKTIDTAKNDMVRIDIGEGPLRHIYIRFADVTLPAGLADVFALRDAIKAMLDTAAVVAAPAADFTPLTTLMQNCCQTQSDGINSVKTGIDTLAQQVTANTQAQTDAISSLQVSNGNLLKAVNTGNATQTQNLQGIHDVIASTSNTQANLLTSMSQALNQLNTTLSGNNTPKDPIRIDESVPMVVYNGYAVSANPAGPATSDPVWAIQRVTRNGDMIIYSWANGNKQFVNAWDSRYNLNYISVGQ
jgi:hypothetical protein